MEQCAWQDEACIADLAEGKEQPFYHVLVHAYDWESLWEPGVTYVPQELLSAPQVFPACSAIMKQDMNWYTGLCTSAYVAMAQDWITIS